MLDGLQTREDLPATYFGLKGTIEAKSAQFEAAEKDLSTALGHHLESPDVFYTLGLVRLQLNDPAEARDVLLRSVKLLPTRAEGWLALGQAYTSLNQRSSAIASIDKAMELGSSSGAVCFGAAAAYESAGEFAKAGHALERIAESNSAQGAAVRTRCLRDLIRGDLPAQASQLALKWRNQQETTAAQHLEFGIAFAENRLYDDATAEFQQSLQLQPSMSEAKYNLALAYLFEQKYDLCAALAKQLAAGSNPGQGHEILGLIKEEQGDPIAARAELQEAVRANPNSANALFQLGRVELQLGDLARAKHDFSASAGACSKACAAPLLGMASTYKLAGDFDQAIQTMNVAIQKNPADAVNYLYLGDIEIRANQLPNAEKTLRTAIRLDPQSALAHYMYAYALLKKSSGDAPQAAIDSLECSIRLDPNGGLARFRLGTILLKRGDYRRAEALLADAVRLEPGLKQAHFEYATVLKKLGRSDLAAKEFGQFAALTSQGHEEDAHMMMELRRLTPTAR